MVGGGSTAGDPSRYYIRWLVAAAQPAGGGAKWGEGADSRHSETGKGGVANTQK
jgi:hypothetical protein